MGRSAAQSRDLPVLPENAPRVRLTGPGGDPVVVTGSGPVLLLGSRRDCDLYLQHAELARTHAAIVHTGQAVLVVDLCSRSGTWLDGKRVRRAALHPQATLRLGPLEIGFELLGEAQAGDAALRFSHPVSLHGAGGVIELGQMPVVIGRRSVCDVVLDTPDTSLAHALIFELDGRPVIADLGSRSGTWLGGQRVQLAYLSDEDALRIGGETLRVRCAATARPPAPQSTSSPRAGSTAPPVAGLAETPSDDDVERLLAGLETRLVALRMRLREQVDQLQHREAALQASEAELAERAARLAQQAEALDEREQKLQAQRDELEQTLAALERDRQRLTSGEKRLQEATRALNEQRREIQQRQSALDQREAKLDERQRKLEQAAARIEKTQAELAQRAAALETRESNLTRRQQALDEQARKLEQVRLALREARQLLGNLDALADDEPRAPGAHADGANPGGLLQRFLKSHDAT